MGVFEMLKDRIQGKAPKGAKRSPKWKEVKAVHLNKNPRCEVCGLNTKLEVHHIIPFHIAPDLELDPRNLITLCENKKYGVNCHLFIGHLGDYSRVNPSVVVDVLTWRAKLGKLDVSLEEVVSDSKVHSAEVQSAGSTGTDNQARGVPGSETGDGNS